MRIVNWNVEWAKAGTDKGNLISEEIFSRMPEVVCLTEVHQDFFSNQGFTITSNVDYGYNSNPNRRKVILWSKQPWIQVDDFGDESLPSGRFICGRTSTSLGEVEFVGVCIPWRDAHVRTGRKNRSTWEDHKSYLNGLKKITNKESQFPLILLGDFNQRVPRFKQPIYIYEQLLSVLNKNLLYATAGAIQGINKQTIDHITHTKDLISNEVSPINNYTSDGKRLSDHFGILVDFQKS